MIETSILIPSKNGAQDIGACLEAVYSQRDVGPIEVVVIDSGSTDSTLDLVRRYPVRIEQIPPKTFHHARTRNYAASLATGEYLVFLSQDAIPASDTWLAAMLGNFSDPAVGAVYGRHLPKRGSSVERDEALNAVYGNQRLVKEPASRQKLGYRYYHFSDANSAIRRDVWSVTRFPEDCKVFEDLGIAKRILGGSWKIVYEPRASVYHSHNHTTVGLFKRYFDIGFTMKRLGTWNDPTRLSVLEEAWNLFLHKLTRLTNYGTSCQVGGSLCQDLAKSAGMFLGLNERFLPRALKRRLSAFRLYE